MGALDRIIGHMVRSVASIAAETTAQDRDESGIVLSPKSAAYKVDDVRSDGGWDEVIGASVVHHVRPRGIDVTKPILDSKGRKFW